MLTDGVRVGSGFLYTGQAPFCSLAGIISFTLCDRAHHSLREYQWNAHCGADAVLGAGAAAVSKPDQDPFCLLHLSGRRFLWTEGEA